MRSLTTFTLQYAHRFYGFYGEAQYLHGHTGTLNIEVEDSVNKGVNMVFPCNEIKESWNVLKNFDHALILCEEDPLLPAIINVYEAQGILNGHPQKTMKGKLLKQTSALLTPMQESL
ncbi:MAG: 6-carboxytetrahydropterin synthase [Prevotella sp.]|nr:6-carboxytetrahydropterin synthase [Prevotella sp.]